MDYVTAASGVFVLGIVGGYFLWLIFRGLTTPPPRRRRFNTATGTWIHTVGGVGGGVGGGGGGFDVGGGFDGGCGGDGGGGDGGC
jgi:hypothetical protein